MKLDYSRKWYTLTSYWRVNCCIVPWKYYKCHWFRWPKADRIEKQKWTKDVVHQITRDNTMQHMRRGSGILSQSKQQDVLTLSVVNWAKFWQKLSRSRMYTVQLNSATETQTDRNTLWTNHLKLDLSKPSLIMLPPALLFLKNAFNNS